MGEVHPSASPAVSVIIPAYQVSRYIAATLDSVRAQTFRDFEILVVNDGAPDTAELEAALEPYQAGIRYLKQENRGPAAARNHAIREANGEYLAFLDGDDLWLPEYLATQMQRLRDDPTLDLIYSDLEHFSGAAGPGGRSYMSMWPSKGLVTPEALLSQQCCVPTSATVARRTAVLEAGLFDEKFRYAEDFDLWVRISLRGFRLGYHTAPLARRRLHEGSLTADSAAHRKTLIQVLEQIRGYAGLTAEALRIVEDQQRRQRYLLYMEEGKRRLLEGQYEAAASCLREAAGLSSGTKARVAMACVSVSPRLARWLALAWGRVLSLKSGR